MAAEASISTGQALAGIGQLLDRVEPSRAGLDASARLELVKVARRAADRLSTLTAVLIAEADAAQSSMIAAGTPTSSWLGIDGKLSKREAAGALHRAQRLAEHPAVADAATQGAIGAGQSGAITKVLDDLAPRLSPDQQLQAEQMLLDFAATMDADQLSKSAGKVLRAVVPAEADELLETRLQREHEAAQQGRSLRLFFESGSVRFSGSLPRVEGEAWVALLNAHAESQRRAVIEARDPLTAPLTPEQRRADALIAMIHAHQASKQAPGSGGDRPRVIVKLDYQALRRGAAAAGVIGEDQPISAGELRQLCCDAGVLPMVLGGASEVLDVGQERRLATPAIRAALTLRDGGCAFPSCHIRAAVCEAHHIRPWWDGGATALHNLVLLCHHHHALVEPAKYGVRDQWEVRLASDGKPEFVPPARFDSRRRPIRHQRLSEMPAEVA